jgi:hypothetical protein
MNIPSEFKIASIAPNHALILPNDANPGRMQFSERTGVVFEGRYLLPTVGGLVH